MPSYPGVNIAAVSPTTLFTECTAGLVPEQRAEPELEPEGEELGLGPEEGVESVCGEDGRWSPDPATINCTTSISGSQPPTSGNATG